jgi:ribonuclease HI
MSKYDVKIYTDGSAKGNPGLGGFGIVMEKVGTDYVKEFSQAFRHTTNNRMELLGVIVSLEKLKKKASVLITSDSKYVIDSVVKGWVFNWERTNFKDKKNPDLWKRFLEVYRKHDVEFEWVKGHNSHPQNERCDVLATTAYSNGVLIDEYYEKNNG